MSEGELKWTPRPQPFGRWDILALLIWTVAVIVAFGDAALLRGAFFYFDVTEINAPYREFLAREIRLLRFSRWCPDLYSGLPLYSESQAGYWHPLKYILYPWLATWKAFALDTVISVWLTGAGTYGWLRRHVGVAGALTGASMAGLGGFTWAHLVHTSMINALASVPFAIWALESAWEGGRRRALALGAIALACQIFAGHLQDFLLTSGLVMVYGVIRAIGARGGRARVLGIAAGMVILAVLLSAVQWIPSKELLDRSPRSEGLTWDQLTYGSWHPELWPTLWLREAYGTRASDTDWMDGFYPYHEMNIYLGLVATALALLGAAAYRDRWAGTWLLIAGLASILMLGRHTFLMDQLQKIPVLGSSREPVRLHLWATFALAALAAVGVDRLAVAPRVPWRRVLLLMLLAVLIALPILWWVYTPAWAEAARWREQYHLDRFRWLKAELIQGAFRTAIIAAAGFLAVGIASRLRNDRARAMAAMCLPIVVLADLIGAHWHDAPTIDPAYWTSPPATAVALREDPEFVRLHGICTKASGEPGYVTRAADGDPIDFLAIRETLAWSLPAAWGLPADGGETPIRDRRYIRFTDISHQQPWGLSLAGVTHIVTDLERPGGERRGSAWIYRVPDPVPRARLLARPYYAEDAEAAAAAIEQLGEPARDRAIVEDPGRPLDPGATTSGTVRIARDDPELVEIEVEADAPGYVVLMDTNDPGWSATLDGEPAEIRPAFVAFRAIFVPAGSHAIAFRYRPAGFLPSLAITLLGAIVAAACIAKPGPLRESPPPHGPSGWPKSWPWWGLALAGLIILGSTIAVGPGGAVSVQSRWKGSWHPFTWGAGIEAMRAHAAGGVPRP